MPGFQPCPTDQWRQDKYLARQQTEEKNRASIRAMRAALADAGLNIIDMTLSVCMSIALG